MAKKKVNYSNDELQAKARELSEKYGLNVSYRIKLRSADPNYFHIMKGTDDFGNYHTLEEAEAAAKKIK